MHVHSKTLAQVSLIQYIQQFHLRMQARIGVNNDMDWECEGRLKVIVIMTHVPPFNNMLPT